MAGRPKKVISDLDKGWEDIVLELMADGASKAEVKVKIGVTNDVHTRWMMEGGIYSETIKEGDRLCMAWWEEKARHAAIGQLDGANATMMIFNLKNRFPDDWRDRTETKHTGHVGFTDMTEDQLDAKLQALLNAEQS